MVEILPSLLAADFARLGEEIARVEQAGVSMLHVDVMDGHFVPNLTMGPPVVKSLRKITKAHLGVHLMITDADRFAPIFIESGADSVSVHQEACPHLDRTLRLIQAEGALAGVVLNPATPVATLDEVLDIVRSVEQVEIVLYLREMKAGSVKLSARSKTSFDVNRLARGFGGGGHRRAAGATIAGRLDEVRARVLAAASAQLAEAGREGG